MVRPQHHVPAQFSWVQHSHSATRARLVTRAAVRWLRCAHMPFACSPAAPRLRACCRVCRLPPSILLVATRGR